MAHVLFYLHILSMIAMLIFPIIAPTRRRALYDWFVQLMAAGVFSYLIETYYPSWEEPRWHVGVAWAIIAWALCIIGFVIAVSKPRKPKATEA